MVYFTAMKKPLIALGITALLCSMAVYPQGMDESVVKWKAVAPADPVRAGERFEVRVEATISAGWHLYSTTQPPGGPIPTRFTLITEEPFYSAGPPKQDPPRVEFDPNFGINTEFFDDSAEFGIPINISESAEPGEYEVQLQVRFQVCDDRMCLPPTRVPIPIQIVLEQGPVRAGREASADAATGTAEAAESASPAQRRNLAGTAAEVNAARSSGFFPYLWLAMSMGAISLATPCVFPMIPITVSFFTKSAESGKSSGISQALVYCVGIIFTFTGLGLGLAAVLGATGVNQFAANPWVNLLITGIFIGFALNLFGLYQIGVPSGVLTKLSKVGGGKGYVPTLLMGLTFTLTSFTCTVPFVGTVLVATSQGDWLWPAMGMLAFSVVFAAPFFILALIPKLLTSMPKSGGWLNSVKVTMGFLEVAAAMKFLSNADLVWNWQIFTREVVLAIWLAIAVLTSVYLLGKFRLPHDSPVESLGVFRMISALLFLAIGFYLFTGLMGGSLGELDAFLPPRTSGSFTLTGGGQKGQELTWYRDLDTALAVAGEEQKPIFIDFTGFTCTNCRWMEANVFPLPAVHDLLKKYVRLQLFTDGAGEEYKENQQYQKERFGTIALPLYVILDSRGDEISTFPGMTRKPEEFLNFLRAPFGAVSEAGSTASPTAQSPAGYP